MHTVNSRVLSALMPGTGALGASASAQLAGNVRNELRRADAAAAAAPAHGKDRKVRRTAPVSSWHWRAVILHQQCTVRHACCLVACACLTYTYGTAGMHVHVSTDRNTGLSAGPRDS